MDKPTDEELDELCAEVMREAAESGGPAVCPVMLLFFDRYQAHYFRKMAKLARSMKLAAQVFALDK